MRAQDEALRIARLFCDGQASIDDLKDAMLLVPVTICEWTLDWDDVLDHFTDEEKEQVNKITRKHQVLRSIAEQLLYVMGDEYEEHDVYIDEINNQLQSEGLDPI